MDISKLVDKLQDTADGGVSRTLARLEERQKGMFRSAAEEAARRNVFAIGARSAFEAALNQNALYSQAAIFREVSTLSAAQRAFADATRGLTIGAELARAVGAIDPRAKGIAQQANALMQSMAQDSYLAKQFTTGSFFAEQFARSNAIDTVVKSLAYAVPPFVGGELVGWEDRLSTRMKFIERPWMLADNPANSILGFAHLTRLSDALRHSTPYAPELNVLLQEELGEVVTIDGEATPEEQDNAAIEAGMRPELIAFPREEYRVIIGAAGLVLNLPPLPIPEPLEGSNPGAAFDPMVMEILRQVETRLRMLVDEMLTRQAGSHWTKHRVPQVIRERWRQRQEEERAKNRPVYAEIYYADLMDLEAVICRGDNWRDSFQDVFPSKLHLSLSLQHLSPIRNDGAHHRPIGMAQRLRLMTEAASILKALGVNIFH